MNSIGCLGACTCFLDDPVFISRLGVKGISPLSAGYERAMEHRSSMVDAKLTNMALSDAVVEEWNGYLLVLVDGKIFMADSRQKYTDETGNVQYEWYYLEGIGVYENQYLEYRYATQLPSDLSGRSVHWCTKCGQSEGDCTCAKSDHIVEVPLRLADSVYFDDLQEYRDLTGQIANAPDDEGSAVAAVHREQIQIQDTESGTDYFVDVYYTVRPVLDNEGKIDGYVAYLVETKGNYTGGVFDRAVTLKTIDDNVFFGTGTGVICSFNFDMRDENGEISPKYYSFDGRTIFSGCATKMDCCGIPHLTKNTVKKSTVIKTRAMSSSAVKIKVRTNDKPYKQIDRLNSSLFSFDDMDFADLSFLTLDSGLFSVKEKEKKWVEKQYFLYSDEYMKPFALYYISFRYNVAGRYKG